MSGQGALAASLASAFARAVASFDLRALVAASLAALPLAERTRVIALGKASPAMMSGAFSVWTTRIDRPLVIAPDGTPASGLDPSVEVVRASHPLPDARSVRAASLVLDRVRGADLVVALISGGTSALVASPCAGVTLDKKREITLALLDSGADVRSINVVRRHLSRIKGGGLTRAAGGARVVALLVSDVIGGTAADIGSGPTVPDPTTVDDARSIVAHYAPALLASLRFHESLKPDERGASRQCASILASPETFASHLGRALAMFDLRVLAPSLATADALAAEYAEIARSLAPAAACLRAAEPSLVVPAGVRGAGGRASHLAALVARDLPPDCAFLAGATDGVDGTSHAAGAAIDGATFRDRASIDASLAAFDTAALHAASGAAIVLGPTGLNFADVHVLARAPRP